METAEAVKWAKAALNANDIKPVYEPKTVVNTPWSTVNRFNTAKGDIYLKQSSPHLCFEPEIIEALSHYTNHTPNIIASNKSFNCLLMTDAGISLRDYIKANHTLDLLITSISEYARIQKQAKDGIHSFLEINLPDWRLTRLTNHFESLINNQALMMSEGIRDDELTLIKNKIPAIHEWCKLLADYHIPETLDHPDFHSNNILIDEQQRLTIIDWSEVTITHPFFSLVTFLNQAERHHSIKKTDTVYQSILNHYLFNLGTDIKNSYNAIDLARKLWPVYAALGFYRLMQSCAEDEFKSYYASRPNRIAEYIRSLLK